MQAEHQEMFFGSQTQKQEAGEGTVGQVKGTQRFSASDGLSLG